MLYWVLRRLCGPVVMRLFRVRVEGVEKVPAQGPAILASNHLSFSDSIFLPAALPRRITFPAKMEYFTQPGLIGAAKRLFFSGTGQIPIDRTGGAKATAALEAGLAVLAKGELFGIYPEGTRSPDGRLYRGKTGMVRMAMRAGVPIIPVAMIDTDKAQPTGQKIPSLVRVGVRFGDPITTDHIASAENEAALIREVTDQVMASLAALSGQEYVDEYAADRKAALRKEAEQKLRERTQAVRDQVDRKMVEGKEALRETGEQIDRKVAEGRAVLREKTNRNDPATTRREDSAENAD